MKESHQSIPRLNQCYLCKVWRLEKELRPVEVPDQVGYVKKLACEDCLNQIGVESKKA